MKFLVNALWFISIGWVPMLVCWSIALMLCLTVFFIPVAIPFFKWGAYLAFPFYRDSRPDSPTIVINNVQGNQG